MEWLLGLFIITGLGFWFWVVCAVFFFVILAFEENDHDFWATTVLVIFGLIMYHNNHIPLDNPWLLAKYAGYYVAAGTLWSIVKIYFYMNKKADEFGVVKLDFIKRYNRQENDEDALVMDAKTTIPDFAVPAFKKFIIEKCHGGYYYGRDVEHCTIAEMVIPPVSTYKQKIIGWIAWWPMSFFWTMLNDPLVKLANFIFDRFQGIYARITKAAFAKFGL